MRILFIDCTKKTKYLEPTIAKIKDEFKEFEHFEIIHELISVPGDVPAEKDFLKAEFFLDSKGRPKITVAEYLDPQFISNQLSKIKSTYTAPLVCFIIDPVPNKTLVNITFKNYNKFGVCPIVCVNDANLLHYIRHEAIHGMIELMTRNNPYKAITPNDNQDEKQKEAGVYGVINEKAKEIELENLRSKTILFSYLPQKNVIWDKMFTLNYTLIGLLKQLVGILSTKRTKQQVIDIMAEAHARFEGFYIPGTIPEKLNNPGCLVYVGQAGAVKHTSGFCQFTTKQQGWDALKRQLELNVSGVSTLYNLEMTFYDYINVYASTSPEHERKNYAEYMASRLGVTPTTKLKELF